MNFNTSEMQDAYLETSLANIKGLQVGLWQYGFLSLWWKSNVTCGPCGSMVQCVVCVSVASVWLNKRERERDSGCAQGRQLLASRGKGKQWKLRSGSKGTVQVTVCPWTNNAAPQYPRSSCVLLPSCLAEVKGESVGMQTRAECAARLRAQLWWLFDFAAKL